MTDTSMNPDTPPAEAKPAGYCRTCGRALTPNEICLFDGIIYCAVHVPIPKAAPQPEPSPWIKPAPVADGASPGLAFLLGLMPGVGAIYNGQYAKGLIHVVIFGLLVSIMRSGAGEMEPLFGMILGVWYFYMPFEAYHTAKKRQRGEVVDEFSGLVAFRRRGHGSNLTGIVLIAAGALFLLVNFEVVRLYEIVRFWPVLLIGAGIYMLYSRSSGGRRHSAPDEEIFRGGID